jgi:hypothetical protein
MKTVTVTELQHDVTHYLELAEEEDILILKFEQIRDTLTSGQPPLDFDHYDWIRPTFEATAATLGIPLRPAVRASAGERI